MLAELEVVKLRRVLSKGPVDGWNESGEVVGLFRRLPDAIKAGSVFVRTEPAGTSWARRVYRVVDGRLREVHPHWVFEMERGKR